jgi:hypothetical protein
MPKPTDLIAQIDYTLHGIPCLIGVSHFYHQKPNYSTWDSDVDYYGYTECEWSILDRKGYPAPWLERKITEDEIAHIESRIVESMTRQYD